LTVSGVLDTAGLLMASYPPISFVTSPSIDLIQPLLTSTSPAVNSTLAGPPAQVTATFSEGMDPISFDTATNFYLQCTGGSCTIGTIGSTLTFSADRTVAILTPTSPLVSGTYLFTVWDGLLDFAGNDLLNYQTVTFTVQ
jgi:hypothetical protein